MKQQAPTWIIVALSSVCSCLLMASLILGLNAWADGTELDEGPRAIPYNGILEFNGQTFTGQADIRFTLTTDNPGLCTFTEDHNDVPVYAGRFSVNIGTVAGDAGMGCLFDASAVYLQMAIRDADEEGEHTPLAGRQRINPVPFAYWASEGSDFSVDGQLRADSADIAGSLSAGGSITSSRSVHAQNATINSAGGNTNNPTLQLQGLYDSNDDLAVFSDYSLLMYQNSTPATSYGLGIQSGTLFLNTGSTFDLKVNGVDEVVINSTGMSVTDEMAAGSAAVTGNTTTGSLNVSGNASIGGSASTDTLTVAKNITAGAWTPAYANWASHGVGAGGAGLYNQQNHGVLLVGNGSHPDRKLHLYDDVTVHGDLISQNNVWGASASTISYGNGAHSQGNAHTLHTRQALCPNGQYMVGINVLYGFHTNDNSSVGEIQAICRSL